jgi:hypothetical protein
LGEERENYFVGRFSGVGSHPPSHGFGATRQHRAVFLYAFSVFEFALIHAIRVASLRLCVFALKIFRLRLHGAGSSSKIFWMTVSLVFSRPRLFCRIDAHPHYA